MTQCLLLVCHQVFQGRKSCLWKTLVYDPVLLFVAGRLESYHSLLLKYADKRHHYQYPAMQQGRLMLATLDYNENISRSNALSQSGKIQCSLSPFTLGLK